MSVTKLICDKCKREIKLKQKHTKVVKVEDDIERMYFKCPHCKTKYTIAYTDTEFRKNIERIKNIEVMFQDKTLLEDEAKNLLKEHDTLIALNKGISQSYREKYESEA